VTINMVIKRALDRGTYGDLVSFLQDRTKRRVIASRMDKAGYSPIRNPDAKDRQWTINGRRYAVYVPKGVAPVRPMLATCDGSLIMLSTPAGMRGEFYRAWTEGENWQRVRVSAEECPRLSKEFLAEELRELGPLMFKQEYGLEFITDLEAMFNSALIAAAFSDEVRPLWH